MTHLQSIPYSGNPPADFPPAGIIDAVREFLSVIEPGPEPTPSRLVRLERSLDRLAYLQHGVAAPVEHAYSTPAPGADYRALRAAVAATFPRLGSYRLPSPVIRIGQGEIELADAIDDITEIASELQDVLWHSEHTSMDEALWHYRNGYRCHWREHVRGLQFHLQGLPPGGGQQEFEG